MIIDEPVRGRVVRLMDGERVASIDMLRGLVMVIMALDHVRDMVTQPPRGVDFAHAGGALYPPGFGTGLGTVYLLWIIVVLALYPACRWFAGVRARRRDWWLSYL